jgi:hypothetical protein
VALSVIVPAIFPVVPDQRDADSKKIKAGKNRENKNIFPLISILLKINETIFNLSLVDTDSDQPEQSKKQSRTI